MYLCIFPTRANSGLLIWIQFGFCIFVSLYLPVVVHLSEICCTIWLMNTPKNPVGRPTKYKPEYCEIAIACGKKGLSREAISSELGITWKTLINWAEEHEDFLLALDEAKKEEMLFFERLALDHMIEGPGTNRLNTALWGRSMAARFPHKYRENSKLEVTGKNDGAIQVDMVHDFAEELMNEILSARQNDSSSADQ